MSAPARTVLGADTLARKWFLDKNTGTHAAPTWTPVGGISNFKFIETKSFQDDSDYDSGGAKSQSATAYEWSLEFTLQRKVKAADATAYDTGQEAVRTQCKRTTGIANRGEYRWYEMNVDDDGDVIGPTTEAYQGYVGAQWGEDGGAMDALDTVSVMMPGQGGYADITHPEAAAQDAIVYSVVPATDVAAGGALVVINGANFFLAGAADVTDVDFGAVACTVFTVLSDNQIAAVVPAGTGSVNVVVTNSVGASDEAVAFIYT